MKLRNDGYAPWLVHTMRGSRVIEPGQTIEAEFDPAQEKAYAFAVVEDDDDDSEDAPKKRGRPRKG